MVKKTGLGKGLDALFSVNIEENNENENVIENSQNEIVKEIKIIDIEPNKNQPRKQFDEQALEELSESIKKYGVLQPIIVSKKDKYYEIIAGERRWRAAKMAGLKAIPAIIKEIDEQTNKEIALIENIQREDLNPIEKARAIKELMNEHDLTQQKAADILGMARSALANTVRLLNLDERVINLAIDGKLTAFPCDYMYLSEKFGPFYIEEVGKYLIKKDVTGEEVGTYFEVHATPTTGDGNIIFKFKSDTETTISNTKCVGYKLQAGNNSGDKLMTCALPNWINFGSAKESIYEQFGQNTKSGSYAKKGSFMLYYSFEEYDINFVGYNDGLYIIDVEYK